MTESRIFGALALLLAPLLLPAAQDDLLVRALEAYRRGNCKEARPLFEQVLARQPKNDAVRRLMGSCQNAPEPKLAVVRKTGKKTADPPEPPAKRQTKRVAERRIVPSKPSMSEPTPAAPPPVPAPPRPVTERDHAGPKYAEAEVLIKAKRFKEASALLVQVVREKPNLVLPRLRLAEIYSANSMFLEAAEQYRAIAGLPGAPEDAGLRVAQNLNWGKKLPEAASAYVDFLEHSPSNSDARLGLANVLFWQNKLPEAAGEYEKYLRLRPRDQEARLNRARALLWTGKYEAALHELLQVKESGAGARDPLLDLAIGQCYEQIQQPERALPYFETALAKSPNQKDAKEARERVANTVLLKNAYLLQEKGDFLAASSAFLSYLEKNPKENDMLLQVARLHSWARDNAKAMLYYEAYLVKKPGDVLALRELARLQLEIPDFAAARKTLAAIVSTDEATADDLANMVNANLWDSRYEEARPWIAKLKQIAPNHDAAKGGTQAVLGKAQAQQLDQARVQASTGKFSEALQSYRRYVERYGANREIELAMARLLAWDSQPVKAIQAYREYLVRYPSDAGVRLELADLERWQGKRGSAEQEYKQVLKSEPGNNKAMFGLAQIADQRGDDRFSVFNAYRDILDRDPSHKVSRERLGDLAARISPSLGYEQLTFHDSDRFNRSMNTIVAGVPLPGGLRISPLLKLGYFSQLRQVGGGDCGTGYDPKSREKDPAIRRVSEDICDTGGHLKGLGGGIRFEVSPSNNVFFTADLSGFKLDTPTQRWSPMLSAELVLRAAQNKRLTLGVKRRSAAFEVNTIGTLYANILTDTAEASFEVPMNDRWNLWVYGGVARYTRGADERIQSNFQKRLTARASYQVTPSTTAGYFVRLSGFRRYSPLYFSPEFYGTTGFNWTWDKPLYKNFRFVGDVEAGYGRIHRYDTGRVNNLELSLYPSFVWDIRPDLSLHIGYRFGRGKSSSFGSPVYSTGTLDMGLTNYFTPSLPPPGMNRIEIR